MKHTVRRQVSEEEQRLWAMTCDAFESDPTREQVNATRIAQRSLPIHETRARQIVRTWENDGLVTAVDNANVVLLTEYGAQVDTIEQEDTGGTSWR